MVKLNQNILLLFFIVPIFVFSQKIDSAYTHNKNVNALQLDGEGKFSEANKVLDDLLAALNNQAGHQNDFAITYQTKAKVLRNLGLYEESINIARKSLQINLKNKDSFGIADSYNTIGVNYYFLSNYDSTRYYYEKSFKIKKKNDVDSHELAVSAYNLAILYEDLAQPKKALKLYLEAEQYLLISNYDTSFLSDVYVGIAHLYFYRKEINKAEEYSEKAIDVGLKSYGEFNPNMTFAYNSYANILVSKKKYKEAIILLEKSLKIRENTYGEYHQWTCESNYILAEILTLDKQYKKAEAHYIKAIEIGEKINSYRHLANARSYLAIQYIEQGIKLEEAEVLLLKAIENSIDVLGYKNDVIIYMYYFLAKIAKKRNQKEKFFDSITHVFNASAYDKNNLNKIISPFQVLDALVLMGDWYKEKYNETKDISFLKNKYLLIDQQLDLIALSQKSFSSDKSKINFANEYRIVFEKSLNTCWELYHITKDEKYLEKAFELSETNRNITLLEGLQDYKFKLFGDIPKELLDYETKIKQDLELTKIDLYYEKIANFPDKEFISDLLDQRILLSNKLDSLLNSFEMNYPRYNNFKYQNKTILISDVQNNLDNDTQLITYFLGENNLYTFNITNDKITFLKGGIANELHNKTSIFKKGLIAQNDIKVISKELYLYLLNQQLNYSKNNLIIIPDNVLNYIPFEILLSENDRYLIEDYTISYSGSVSLFLEFKSKFFNYSPPNYWAGFSPKYEGSYMLSSNFKEVSKISRIVNGKHYVGETSNKQSFLENNKNYSILHLAMHAEIDNENPMFNKLIFSDGELSASEIYLSNTQANLTVLSACNTGFGKLEKGEGIMSMARAFHFSGVPSVIMSLWKVPDKETKIIMIAFYKHLEKGKTKSEALKNAKLDYLASTNDINLRHPYYWSGFILNGNTRALKKSNKNQYLIGGGGLILLGLLFWGIKYKQKETLS